MTNYLVVFSVFLLNNFNYDQDKKIDQNLINRTFFTTIRKVCEETPEPDPCAGYIENFNLEFTKTEVFVTEKRINTCNQEYTLSKLNYKWKLIGKDKIEIFSNPNEIEFNFLKNLVLKFKDDRLIGYKDSKNFYFKKT